MNKNGVPKGTPKTGDTGMSNFGKFSEDGREFIFHTPATPRPMLNYMWNERFLSGVNQQGGGEGAYGGRAACYIDEEGRGRAVIIKDGRRYFYVRDMENGDYWNPGWYPVRASLDHYRCIHGLGYSVIEGERGGISLRARGFVNDSDPTEIWTLTVRNLTDQVRKIQVYSAVEFDLTGYKIYSNYYSNVFGTFDAAHHLLMAWNNTQDRTHAWYNGFLASSLAPDGFDTGKKAFLGLYGSFDAPEAVAEGRCRGSLAACEDLAGVLQHTFTLGPGKEVTYQVLIGAADSREEALRMTEKMFAPGTVEREFLALRCAKERMCDEIVLETPDDKINHLVNAWIKQQVQLCAEAGRDTGKGFRDQLQDAWAITSFHPQLAAGKILEALRYQYLDGHTVRGWLPLDTHNYSDGPTWIAPTVNAYLKETGDFHFLETVVPYLDQGEGTVWDHILRAVRYSSEDLGAHGLVLAHDGDWNDSLNGIGVGGRGESVWTSMALYFALNNTKEIAEQILKDRETADEMHRRAERIRTAVNENGWDKDWYLAGYTDQGEPVGSFCETEGSIYLNSQTWAVYTGIADPDKAKRCLEAADRLLDSPYGPLTLFPTYTAYRPKIGRLTSFVPGIWENGTPYCHGGTFKIVADCCAGRGQKAYETMKKILPDSRENPSDQSGCEPYALTNMYFGPDNPRAGQTMFAWVTGTAGWMFRAATQYMAGFFPGYESVTVRPVLPSKWRCCTLRRRFRGDCYILHIDNGGTGEMQLTVDGKSIQGDTFPIFGDGREHTIVCRI